ncbi:MAG: hypothetical protein Q8Q38_03275 [bacterium]|nr:hypothetical protein [bacterium]
MNPLRIAGVLLIVVGLAVIGSTLWYSYLVFTGGTQAPQLFEVAVQETGSGGSGGLEQQIGSVIGDQINSVLPPDAVSRTLNLAAWSLFAGVAIFAGSQVASVGIKLL